MIRVPTRAAAALRWGLMEKCDSLRGFPTKPLFCATDAAQSSVFSYAAITVGCAVTYFVTNVATTACSILCLEGSSQRCSIRTRFLASPIRVWPQCACVKHADTYLDRLLRCACEICLPPLDGWVVRRRHVLSHSVGVVASHRKTQYQHRSQRVRVVLIKMMEDRKTWLPD